MAPINESKNIEFVLAFFGTRSLERPKSFHVDVEML
jgi:hypothetical protein